MTHEELLLFGEKLRRRRDDLHFKQENVSENAGISLRYYQMLERGEKSVSLDTLIRLSKALSISIDYLLLGDCPNTLANPIVDVFNGLSPQQRYDALKILQLYSKACKEQK